MFSFFSSSVRGFSQIQSVRIVSLILCLIPPFSLEVNKTRPLPPFPPLFLIPRLPLANGVHTFLPFSIERLTLSLLRFDNIVYPGVLKDRRLSPFFLTIAPFLSPSSTAFTPEMIAFFSKKGAFFFPSSFLVSKWAFSAPPASSKMDRSSISPFFP